jgi:IclR family mhp operon transcriptional activator
VPVLSGDRLLGAVNMVFPKEAVSRADLSRRYLPRLRRLADTIGEDSRSNIDAGRFGRGRPLTPG